jgi:hypothetical protein
MRLIESPPPEPARMQRHRQDHIDAVLIPKKHKGRQEKFTQWSGQLNFALVFKAVNDFRDNPVVYQRRPGQTELVISCQACPAMVILSLPALKRYAAADAQRRFDPNQLCETVRAQAGCQRYLQLGLERWRPAVTVRIRFGGNFVAALIRDPEKSRTHQALRWKDGLLDDLVESMS